MASNGETGSLLLAASACVHIDVCVLEAAAARVEEQTDHGEKGEEHSRENECRRPNTIAQKWGDGQILSYLMRLWKHPYASRQAFFPHFEQ